MQTYTHLITSAVLTQVLKNQTNIPVCSKAFLLGSVAPDIGLGLLTGGFLLNRRLKNEEAMWCGDEFNAHYFNDPLWIVGHNLLHGPFMIVLMIAIGYYMGRKRNQAWGWSLLWFAAGCGIHTAVDVFTHHNDGPLLLFPFDWQSRFFSSISYWDRAHGAAFIAPLEHLVDLILVLFLVKRIWNERRRTVAK